MKSANLIHMQSQWLRESCKAWLLACASGEVIFHRLTMIGKEAPDHPEFSRMIVEKEQAFADGMIAWSLAWQKLMFDSMLRPLPQANAYTTHLLKNMDSLTNAAMRPTRRTANANATRLRKRSSR